VPGRLADGRRWRSRRLRPGDAPSLVACFGRMSEEARQARFFGARAQLGAAEVDQLCSPDGWEHIALGAFAVDRDGRERELLGAVRCLRLPARRDTAELAIAVADDAAGLGLGRGLLAALMASARPRGIRTLHLEVLSTNRPMRALAEAAGAVLRDAADGVVTYRLPLRPAAGRRRAPEPPLPPLLDPVAAARHWLAWLDEGVDGAAAGGIAALDAIGAYCTPGSQWYASATQSAPPPPAS
jgi:RimJ/RimL family protein N-acetyltransferase